jgi:hypothetical protein
LFGGDVVGRKSVAAAKAEHLIQRFTPQNIERASARKDASVFDICERAPELFPSRELMQVFNTLGWNAVPHASWSSTVAGTRSRLGSAVGLLSLNSAHASSAEFCNCSGWGWCECNGGETCNHEGPSCTPKDQCGCGEDPSECDALCIPETEPASE